MRLSCRIDLAPGDTISERAAFLAEAGFDGIELLGTARELADQSGVLRQIASDHGLDISAICALHRGWLIDPRPDRQREARADIRRLLELAAEIGARSVYVVPIVGRTRTLGSGPTTGRTREGDRAVLIDALTELRHGAEQTGTVLLLKAVNRYVSPIANRVAECIAILQAVDSPQCRLAVDFFHMNIEESDMLTALGNALPILSYVNLADSNMSFPNRGHLDYRTLLGALTRMSYVGDLALGHVEDDNPSRDTAATLKATAGYLRGLIERTPQCVP